MYFLTGALAAFLFSRAIICAILVEGIMRKNSVFISNLGQWFRRCRLKDFLSGALAALLFGGAEPLTQFRKSASWGTFV